MENIVYIISVARFGDGRWSRRPHEVFESWVGYIQLRVHGPDILGARCSNIRIVRREEE